MKAVALVGPWTLIKVPLSCVEGEGHNFEEEAVEKKRDRSRWWDLIIEVMSQFQCKEE